ncbi:MAG: carboxylating nicotinate-nucleotide diphosphorylase [Vicinamibacteria bacterium]|nr:carboxylating nicotinate-nucleotide diphosphorylase [Vicinamibacteria bacterium]
MSKPRELGIIPGAFPGPNRQQIERLVRVALDEDVGGQDTTTEASVPPHVQARGEIIANQPMIVACLETVHAVFRVLDPQVAWEACCVDGQRLSAGDVVARVQGNARPILTAERVALNFLQRMSGVATITRRFVDAVAGTGAVIRDTRKTTPLLRALEKHAVALGGGAPHRSGLDDGILIKENHIRLAGSVQEATRRALACSHGLIVEVEVERMDEVVHALDAGAEMILLDNFSPALVAEAVRLVAQRVPIEVSGGIRLETVRSFAEAGPDFIAIGALTHSAPAVDVSLEIASI